MDEKSKLTEWVAAHRRYVMGAAAVFLIAILIIRFKYLLELGGNCEIAIAPLLRNQIVSLLSTIIVSGALATFFWWFRPPPSRLPAGGEIFPDTIGEHLRSAALEADEWEYVGHTARFVRASILPTLEKRAKSNGTQVKVRFVILDPTCGEVCEKYAQYRTLSRSSSIAPRPWTAEEVQVELLTSIICLIQAKAGQSNLDVHLAVTEQFTLWRFDRSDRQIIVTQEDPQQPAYRYLRGSRFYGYHRQECELIWSQAKVLPVHPTTGHGRLSQDEIVRLLQKMFGRKLTHCETLIGKAYQMSEKPVAPYA